MRRKSLRQARRKLSKPRGARKRQVNRPRNSASKRQPLLPASAVSSTSGTARPRHNRVAEALAKAGVASEREQKWWRRMLRAKSSTVRRDARKLLKRMAWLRDCEEQEAKAPKRDSGLARLDSAMKRWNKLASRTLGLQIGTFTLHGCDITVQLIPANSQRQSRLSQAVKDDKGVLPELLDIVRRAALFAASRSDVRSFRLHISGAALPPDVFAECAPVTQQSQESSPKTTICSEASVQSSSPSSDATPRLLCPPKTEGVTRREEDEPAFAHGVSQFHA